MATAMTAPLGTHSAPKAVDDDWGMRPSRGSSRLLQRHRRILDAEIEHATQLITSQELEGDEGIYDQGTLDRAIRFLRAHIRHVWEFRGTTAPIPSIGPGPAKSVDLYWKQSSWKLLVNIPAEGAEATFYGDDYGRNKTEGSLDPNDLSPPIVSWLTA